MTQVLLNVLWVFLKHETLIFKAYFHFLTAVKKALYGPAKISLGIVANVFVFSADLNYFMAILYSSFRKRKQKEVLRTKFT